MNDFDRIFAAAADLAGIERAEDVFLAGMEAAAGTEPHLAAAIDAVRARNSPEAKVGACVDLLLKADGHETALNAAAQRIADLAKDVKRRASVLRCELLPLAAEGDIEGRTHAARYTDGRERVVIDDAAAAYEETPGHLWRHPDPVPDKNAFRAAIKAGARWKHVRLEPGDPGLSLVKTPGREPKETI